MKKKYIIIITIVIAIIATVLAISFGNKVEKAKIIVATDTHYLSSRINDGGKFFTDMINNSDGKLVQYCDEIFSAFSNEVVEKKPDVLILSGDLSFNGEKTSHKDFAKKLKEIQDSGVQVLTIAGNHDINIENSAEFKGDKAVKTDSVSVDEFKEIYYDFGMKQAESVDENSLSYIYKVNDDLYVLMLDTNAYGENFVQDPSYQWIEEQLKMVKKNRAKVITVTHQNLIAHNEELSFGYTLYDANELLELFKKYNVKCNLSGHIHMQHFVDGDVPEIVTSSLIVNTTQYGEIDFDGKIHYQTKRVDVENWAKNNNVKNDDLLNFSSYSVDFFKSSGRMSDTIDSLGLNDEEKDQFVNAIGELNSSYFAGTSIDSSKIEGIEVCKNMDNFLNGYIEIMLNEAENDYNSIVIN